MFLYCCCCCVVLFWLWVFFAWVYFSFSPHFSFFLTPLPPSLTAVVKRFYPVLNMLSHRCHQLVWGLSCVLHWVWQSCLHWLAGCGSSLSSLKLALQALVLQGGGSSTCPRTHDEPSYWFWINNCISSLYGINSPEVLNEKIYLYLARCLLHSYWSKGELSYEKEMLGSSDIINSDLW